MAQLPAMGFPDRFIESCQDVESIRGYPGQYHPAILVFPGARNQAALLQAIKQASDVRIACNHATRDLSAGETVWCPPQDSEHVVLRWREVLSLQRLRRPTGKHVGGAQQIQERSFLGTGRPFAIGPGSLFHSSIVVFVITTTVKTDIQSELRRFEVKPSGRH